MDGDDVSATIVVVTLNSALGDAYFLKAKPRGSRIEYCLSTDESAAGKIRPRTTEKPLTLAQLIRLIQTAEFDGQEGGLTVRFLDENWREVHQDLESLEELHGFVSVSSDVYPELEVYFEREMDAWFGARKRELELEAEENDYSNREHARWEGMCEEVRRRCTSVEPQDPSLRRFATWCVHVVRPWLRKSSLLLDALLAWESGTGEWTTVERERTQGAEKQKWLKLSHYLAGLHQQHANYFSNGAEQIIWEASDPDPRAAAREAATNLLRLLEEFPRVTGAGKLLPAPNLGEAAVQDSAVELVLAQLRRMIPGD